MASQCIRSSRFISRRLECVQTTSRAITATTIAATGNTRRQSQHAYRCQYTTASIRATARSKPVERISNSRIYTREQLQRYPSSHQPKPYSTTPTFQDQNQNQNKTPKPGETPPLDPDLQTKIRPSKIYSFEDMQSLITPSSSISSSSSPEKKSTQSTIIIDVREPSEIIGTGRIPGSKNIPISTAPDSFFLNEEDFQDRFGFEKPAGKRNVVFYCKAGVRSGAAARLALQAGWADSSHGEEGSGGGKEEIEVGEFPGSWVEWFDKGGKIERD